MSGEQEGDLPLAPGDRAFLDFVRQHFGEWLRALLRLAVAQTDAELILDRALEELARCPTFDPGRRGANQYVHNRLKHRARDFHRSPRSRTATVPGTGPGASLITEAASRERSPLLALGHAEARRVVWQAVCGLPEPWQFAVVCRYWLELSPPAIAALRGAPLTTINNWLSRGCARLREELGPGLFPEGA